MYLLSKYTYAHMHPLSEYTRAPPLGDAKRGAEANATSGPKSDL